MLGYMKKYLVLIFLLGLLIVAAGCLNQKTDPNDTCGSLEGTAKDQCYADAMKCSKIKGDLTRDLCVVELAKIQADPAICELVQDDNVKGNCEHQFVSSEEACSNIENEHWRNACNFKFASELADSTLCGVITNTLSREQCYQEVALITGNGELCFHLGQLEGIACIRKVAKKTLDPDVCKLIKGRDLTQGACISTVAKLAGREDWCDTIVHELVRGKCKQYFEKQVGITAEQEVMDTEINESEN